MTITNEQILGLEPLLVSCEWNEAAIINWYSMSVDVAWQLIGRLRATEARLKVAEAVCEEAQWVLQDPSLTSSACSSEPWEQPVDSRVGLDTALKAWRTSKEIT